MIVKLLTEHHLESLSLKGGYRGSSESTLVKVSNCWKSYQTETIEKNKDFKAVERLHQNQQQFSCHL